MGAPDRSQCPCREQYLRRNKISYRRSPLLQDSSLRRLAKVPLFAALSDGDLTTIAGIAVQRTYATGERIVTEGEEGAGLYVVLSGRVEVRSNGTIRATLDPGSVSGEMGLFEEQPRTAAVVAIEPSTFLVLSREESWGQPAREPELPRNPMRALVRRLRTTPHALTERARGTPLSSGSSGPDRGAVGGPPVESVPAGRESGAALSAETPLPAHRSEEREPAHADVRRGTRPADPRPVRPGRRRRRRR